MAQRKTSWQCCSKLRSIQHQVMFNIELNKNQNIGEISCKLKFQVKLNIIDQIIENHKLVKLDKLVNTITECKMLRATTDYINKKL